LFARAVAIERRKQWAETFFLSPDFLAMRAIRLETAPGGRGAPSA
jgi:hypothetical protein